MENLFATELTRDLMPKIKEFIENELKPLETIDVLTGRFSYIEKQLKEKRELVKKAGWWGLGQSLSLE
jgi:acyl-CoA dehydrogenase